MWIRVGSCVWVAIRPTSHRQMAVVAAAAEELVVGEGGVVTVVVAEAEVGPQLPGIAAGVVVVVPVLVP